MVDSAARTLGSRLIRDAGMREAAGRFFTALDEAGIRAAPIKGLAVSAALYDDPLEREFGDVDVLVAYPDVAAVVELARRRRFALVYDSKQLGCVNVVVPPGIPFDVRGSIGPPGFAAVTAGELLARAEPRSDRRVCDAKFWWLDERDHLLFLLVDALMDKLAVKVAVRLSDLPRALARWMGDPEEFGRRAHDAGLAVAAHLVLEWLEGATGDEGARRALAALGTLPAVAGGVAGWLGPQLRTRVHAWPTRIGVRLAADDPRRGLESLVLGAVGVARFWMRNGFQRPWRDPLWAGPGRPPPPG